MSTIIKILEIETDVLRIVLWNDVHGGYVW